MFHTNSRGFTLTELIVVIAIIGILTAIVSVNLADSRAKARDAKRVTELEQIHLAVEAYREAYGAYPLPGCGDPDEWCGENDSADYIENIESLLDLPVDPSDTEDGFRYISDGTSYRIESYNARESGTTPADHEYAACDESCGNSECAVSDGEYSEPATAKTYAVWSGSDYQCSQETY